MNKGTIIRVVIAIAMTINTANVMTAFAEFDNPVVNTIYKTASLLAFIIIGAAGFYYNNDFTEEANIGTGITRQLKAEKKPDYVGDKMFPNYDELEDEEEDGEENE